MFVSTFRALRSVYLVLYMCSMYSHWILHNCLSKFISGSFLGLSVCATLTSSQQNSSCCQKRCYHFCQFILFSISFCRKTLWAGHRLSQFYVIVLLNKAHNNITQLRIFLNDFSLASPSLSKLFGGGRSSPTCGIHNPSG